jgi:hypothetical protein
VVGVGLVDEQHLPAGRQIGEPAVHRHLHDVRVALGIGEVDEQAAAVGREDEPQQALLGPAAHLTGDVEDDPGVDLAVADGPDPAPLLGDVEGAVAGPHGHGQGLDEGGDAGDPELHAGQL